jgi:hypothetical protein
MRNSRLLAGAGASAAIAALLLAVPVTGQPDAAPPSSAPRSLLPDSFREAPPPRVAPAAPLLPPAASAAPTVPAPGAATLDATPAPVLSGAAPLAPADQAMPAQMDAFAGAGTHDMTIYGPLQASAGGYGPAVFQGSNGRFLAGLAWRITAPIGSRWAAIVVRRSLLSASVAPDDIAVGTWVAARAWMLLKLGEIDGAKALTDRMPIDHYSPALYRVAAQVSLAAADVAGLCPIAATGQLLSKDPLWKLAIGMCAAIQGDDITAADTFDTLRSNSRSVDPFDVRLGERIATLAGGAGRASSINWNEAPVITPYRYGVATAAGVTVPGDSLAPLGPARYGWLVRNPGVDPKVRLAMLRQAAVIGTVSAAELVSSVAALSTEDAEADTRAGRLRTAFAGGSMNDRRAALRGIWASGAGAEAVGDSTVDEARYGALLESATAAAQLPIGAASAADSANIIAALLAAGDTAAARRWWPVADKADPKVRASAWALLATGAGGVPVSPGDFKDWRSASGADARHASMLLAALAGIGAANGSDWSGLRGDLLPKGANSWTRAIDAAATAGRLGEVTMLTATGLQGPWTDVPSMHLYHIVAALVQTGRGAEARLIAAEAMTRA